MQPLRKWQAKKAWAERTISAPRRPSRPYQWNKGAKLLLLVNQDDQQALSSTRAFAKTQQNLGKEVKILNWTGLKHKKEECTAPDTWNPSVLNFSKLPKTEAEQEYLRKEFDVVIHCSLTPFEAFDYLAAGLCAHKRIAAYDTAIEAYDLIISPKTSGKLDDFLKQVIHYLDVLKV